MGPPEQAGPGKESQANLGKFLENVLADPSAQAAVKNLFENLSIPQWEGPFSAEMGPIQGEAVDRATGALRESEFDVGAATAPLERIAGGETDWMPEEARDILGRGAAEGPLGQLFAGSGQLDALSVAQELGIDVSALEGFAGLMGPTAGEEALTGMAGFTPEATLTEIARTGGRQDIEALLSAEEARSRRRITEEQGNIRGQFAGAGTRRSVGAARGVGEFTSRALEAERGQALATRASLLESSAGRRLAAGTELQRGGLMGRGQDIGAADILGRLGAAERARATGAAGTLAGSNIAAAEAGIRERGRAGEAAAAQGQLRLGAASEAGRQDLTRAGTMGELFQGAMGRELAAALGLPGAQRTAELTPFEISRAAWDIGESERGVRDVDVTRRQAEFTRTSGALFAPIINAILGQPTAFGPSTGSQIAGAAGTAAAGKGGGGIPS